MPIYKILNPYTNKEEEVDFDSDPTDEQLDEVFSFFDQEANPQRQAPSIDFTTATVQEIQDYNRLRREMGIDPYTGEQITEEEYVRKYKEPGVDYETGLDSVGGFSRFQFGRMDNAAEKENYLKSIVGDEGFRKDKLGRFILTKDGRQKLNLGEGRELSIDEEGFTFNDVKEFAGEVGLPLLTGVGASIAASGVGFVPGVLIAGAATAAGKFLDEGIEYAEGLQRQSFEEVARDAAFEGVLGGTGELIGRGISKIFGRLIKGPGGAENEALRAQAREIIGKGFRPTIAGATDEAFRPILNRLQAVYEGVFPNKVAAENNLNKILDDLNSFGFVDKSNLKNLGEVVKKDINTYYSKGTDLLNKTQQEFNRKTTKEIENLIDNLRTDKVIPKDLADMIRMRKRVFDEDVDKLYTKVDDILKGKKIVSTKGIKESLEQLEKDTISDIGATKFARTVRGLGDFETVKNISRIRTGLLEATKNPALLNEINVGSLQSLKKAVDSSFDDALLNLSRIASSPKIVPGSIVEGPNFGSFAEPSLDEAAEALGLLSRTNDFYKKSIKRFDNITVQNLIKQAQQGEINTNFILNKILLEDDPEGLDRLFKAIRGAPTGKALGAEIGISDLDEGVKALKTGRIGESSIEDALKAVRGLDENSSARKTVEAQARRLEEQAAEISKIRGSGAEIAEQVRQTLAKKYLETIMRQSLVVDPKTGAKVIDPIILSGKIREKGTAIDKLFKGELKELEDVMSVLERGKADLAPETVERLRGLPLGNALLRLKQVQKGLQNRQADQLTQTLASSNNPDVLASAIFKDVPSIRKAKRILQTKNIVVGDTTVNAFEATQDAAMGRILKQLGATVDDQGVIKLTDDFVEGFKSGRLGSKFQKVLDSYGPQTLDEMFGKGANEGLNALAETMIKVSNAPITGKGGLAAPQIALALSSIAFIMNPIATAGAAAGYAIMSKALRNPAVLKMMMASRQPNTVKQFLQGKFAANDPIAQGFQTMQTLTATTGIRGTEFLAREGTEEITPLITATTQDKEDQNLSQMQVPIIQPPAQGTQVSNINPITIPDPNTLGLAQLLQQRKQQL